MEGQVELARSSRSQSDLTSIGTAHGGGGIDTLIVTGRSTSGCIRATVEDSIRFGFRTIVPAEAVGDRSDVAHEANMFDIDSRYADVVCTKGVLAYLEGFAGNGARVVGQKMMCSARHRSSLSSANCRWQR